ncbi:MAG: hydroxymethylglutaryl-CoA reductase, degradative, partial [Proteobacteria bacterium]|nr:hydroxymethylglutaryl-CoA reductase, degradative [Pseudomonadota bacterium]
MSSSRISGLHELTVAERINELDRLGWLSSVDAELLKQGRYVLLSARADTMVENVIGTFGLPLAIAPNFVVNGRDYIVPMVVEEPSVVAAVSGAAKLARSSGGFETASEESLLAGQVHVTNFADTNVAITALEKHRQELIRLADDVHPGLVDRGGGAREVEVRLLELPDGTPAIAIHILVDTCDAMGANIVNTICESVAPRIGEICGGDVALRILSNLSDRSLVTARVSYRLEDLATSGFAAEIVRDRIIMASDIARVDPYRAATHNKGIMNGVDALAIATGNDWRAIEAGAHAYAAMSGQYSPLSTWSAGSGGDLVGELSMPIRVATVGGTLNTNVATGLAIRMSGVKSSQELAELMAAVGLAQNFAAIRALATHGIQDGHMKLHGRGTASARDQQPALLAEPMGTAAGKVILLGEHAVVYGRHAVALPIADAVTASVAESNKGSSVSIRQWGVKQAVTSTASGAAEAVQLILSELEIDDGAYSIDVRSTLPRAMGLGSSAAVAVAVVRAFSRFLDLDLDDERVNSIAFACEKLAHGTPSGIDNSIATIGTPMLFSNAGAMQIDELVLQETPPIVIALSGQPGLTLEQVAGVRSRYQRRRDHYDAIFDQIDALSLSGAAALQSADYEELGSLMNICHGLLNAIEVSTPEIENMVNLARTAGATGAKLTGGGGGGSVVVL